MTLDELQKQAIHLGYTLVPKDHIKTIQCVEEISTSTRLDIGIDGLTEYSTL